MPVNSHVKTILAIIIVVVVGVVMYFVIPDGSTTNREGNVEITVREVNLAKANTTAEKIPKGFPAAIPVLDERVVESYSSHYKDRGYTQYTVAYETFDDPKSLVNLYEVFMQADGYDVTDSSFEGNISSIYGTKDDNDLSIVIMDRGDGDILVTLNYLQR